MRPGYSEVSRDRVPASRLKASAPKDIVGTLHCRRDLRSRLIFSMKPAVIEENEVRNNSSLVALAGGAYGMLMNQGGSSFIESVTGHCFA
jgi:hypothetical protein